jgi:hypothetical protein
MSEIDNPPAFPSTRITGQANIAGMSLRDWFAGQALAGILAGNHPITRGEAPTEDCAAAAYTMADAMLAERKKEYAS